MIEPVNKVLRSKHQESIEKFLNIYKDDKHVLAILLGGSIAHGFAQEDSDIDIILVVEDEEFQKRKREKKLAFSLWDICTYEGGYIDVKVNNMEFLRIVSERGSDPARYAYKDNIILFSRISNIASLLNEISVFPVKEKGSRKIRFASQLLAWKWFYSEGVKKKNQYLIYLAVQKIVLFSCRIILNENNMIYPYHKWLLNETNKAPECPENFQKSIQGIMEFHNSELVNEFCLKILNFSGLEEKEVDWPNHFLADSEMNWLHHEPPVDDL